ncbi:MAG: undecaprenyldiphospho-muramoylpentapeptide beta-N-acetylglucosaminyltransferase [Pseudomonadota bacterium]
MRLLLAAGGTGGTVLPAIVVARAVRTLDPAAEILFVGTARGFEMKLVPQAGFTLELLKIGGLKRKGAAERLRNLLALPAAFIRSWRLISRFSPEAVFGTGGYASGPILLLASLRRIRTAILEPNSMPGFANRVLARVVGRIYLAFEASARRLPPRKCAFSGLPVRPEILAVPPPSFEGERRTLLIFGGSQGARKLNDAMAEALPKLAAQKNRLYVIHQTGVQDEARIREAYARAGMPCEVRAFIDDMASAYARADLVVARSGSSVLEVAAVGRPAILVPFPFAADDHQRLNADVVVKAGAAVVIDDADLTGERLFGEIEGLLFDRGRLKAMSRGALTLRRERAAETIAADLLGRKAA